MAILLPIFCSVKGPKRLAASGESVKFTCHMPGLEVLRVSTALRRSRPVTTGARSRRYQTSLLSVTPLAPRLSDEPVTNSVPGASQVPDIVVLLGDQVAKCRDLRRIDVANQEVRVVNAAHFIVMDVF